MVGADETTERWRSLSVCMLARKYALLLVLAGVSVGVGVGVGVTVAKVLAGARR